eukprot:TRINITY_DN35350_c0_g1_i1.p1 TRINITY_DN35350_c0_g1~~TRINITY_DN35350_c0_g1_i1.p1  ORF type:complete len:596 (-),score=91.16 TRINITY_DN35350_c0_g1_i1:166-1953(-)
MGVSTGKCCSVTTAKKATGDVPAGGSVTGSFGGRASVISRGVKSIADFKRDYEQKDLIRPGVNVATVMQRDTLGEYVCRKIEIASMPCKSAAHRSRHIQTLACLEHPHMCKFVEAFEDSTHMYLIYEKAEHTTLFEHVRGRKSLTEDEAADYVRQVTAALAIAHGQGIVHGRLCPRKLILSPNFEDAEADDCEVQIKICDVGQGYILRPAPMEEPDVVDKMLEMERYALSPEHAFRELPEAREGAAPRNADKCDMWALGIIVYHMLSNALPFKTSSREDIASSVQQHLVSFDTPNWQKLSDLAREAVAGLLKVNPGIRLSANALLRHPWIRIAKVSFPRRRMAQLLENLKCNIEECEFKKFVLRVIAEHMPLDGRVAVVVEQAFRCLDRNGDGVLTVEEIIKGLKKHMSLSSEELSSLFEQVDRDGSGTLNAREFLTVTMDQKRMTSLPILWQAFNAFDADSGGEITFDEIDQMVREVEGALLGKDQVASLAQEIRKELEEVSHKGSIDFDQFVYIMQNSSPSWTNAGKTDVCRILWNKCGIDMHNVRQINATWGDKNKGVHNPSSPLSVYRRRDPNRRTVNVRKTQTTEVARAG